MAEQETAVVVRGDELNKTLAPRPPRPETGLAAIPVEKQTPEERFAIAAFKSQMFGSLESAWQALVKIQLGKELGFGPATSLQLCHVIDGKPVLTANTMAALVKRANPRYDYRTVQRTNERAEIAFYEQGFEVGRVVYTVEDARVAKLLDNPKKDVWQKYRAAMLWARAISIGFRLYCGDLAYAGNVYTAEEIGGEVQEAEVQEIPPAVGGVEPLQPGFTQVTEEVKA